MSKWKRKHRELSDLSDDAYAIMTEQLRAKDDAYAMMTEQLREKVLTSMQRAHAHNFNALFYFSSLLPSQQQVICA